MKIDWVIEKEEVLRIKRFMKLFKNHPLVQRRLLKNVKLEYIPDVGKERIWFVLLTCLLSTQQRSGASSPLYKFCSQKPFPLNYHKCFMNKKRFIAIGVMDQEFVPILSPEELEMYSGKLDKIMIKRSRFSKEELDFFVIPSVKVVAGSILCID